MQVNVKMTDVTIPLGNNGITLAIADNAGTHVGHLRIGQATVEWRRGKVQAGNGKKVPLVKLLEYIDQS